MNLSDSSQVPVNSRWNKDPMARNTAHNKSVPQDFFQNVFCRKWPAEFRWWVLGGEDACRRDARTCSEWIHWQLDTKLVSLRGLSALTNHVDFTIPDWVTKQNSFNFSILCCVIRQNCQLYYSVLHHKEKLSILLFFVGSQGKTVSCWVTKQTMSTILFLGHGGFLIYIGVRPSHFKLLSWYRLKIERMPPQHEADTHMTCKHIHSCKQIHTWLDQHMSCVCAIYGVATVSRIDKITGLFCRISSLL